MHEHLVRGAGENLAGKSGVSDFEPHGGEGLTEIEFTTVVADLAGREGKIEMEVAERLVGVAVGRGAVEAGVGETLRLVVAPLANQAAQLGQVLPGVFAVGVGLRIAGPDGDIIELQTLAGRLPENHRAEASVADRQRLDPRVGRLAIPQHEPRLLRLSRRAGQRAQHGQKQGDANRRDATHGEIRG